jgi:2-dehydro-3-deoxygalactonokinase
MRLRLVDRQRRESVAEVKGEDGIPAVYARWQQTGDRPEGRIAFYQAVLAQGLEHLQRQTSSSVAGLPFVLSGMASSSLGMVELPYRQMPFDLTGSNLVRAQLPASDHFGHAILLVSGARAEDDVMRGEETQLVGCAPAGDDERLYILPGTHSKHVLVRHGMAVSVSTFMTGEIFQLLAAKSILAVSVTAASSDGGAVSPCFLQGIRDSRRGGILQTAFRVRTRHILSGTTNEENYRYLSGLLIGEELKTLTGTEFPLAVVGAGRMKEYYTAGAEELGLPAVSIVDADHALVRGHCRLLELDGNDVILKS